MFAGSPRSAPRCLPAMFPAPVGTLVHCSGLLTTGTDAVPTACSPAESLEQGNAIAAQAEITHSLACNVGGWAGGASTAVALGGSGFVPWALVFGDALRMSNAFDKGADLPDSRAIYHQTGRAGVEWQFNGRNWQRDAAIELAQDDGRTSGEQPVVPAMRNHRSWVRWSGPRRWSRRWATSHHPQTRSTSLIRQATNSDWTTRSGGAIPRVWRGSVKPKNAN